MDTTNLKNRMSDKMQEIQPTTDKANSSGYLALASNALDVIRENLKISRCHLTFSMWSRLHPAALPCSRFRVFPERKQKRNS